MKLAILAQGWLHDKTAKVNGTLVQLHNLTVAFAERGVEVHYIATTGDKTKPGTEQANGVTFHWLQTDNQVLGWKKNMMLYRKILEGIHPDALYVRGRNVFQYVAGRYAHKNNKIFVWGTNGDDGAEFWKNTRRLLASSKGPGKKILLLPLKILEDRYINIGMKMPSVIVNQSVQQQESTRTILHKEGIVLPSYFLPVDNQIKKENLILWLANLSHGKQPEVFIQMIRDLNMQSWKALLGGGTTDAIYASKIKNLISGLPIQLAGKITFRDSQSFYQKARLYVNTSKTGSDGLPNAYIQSWLSGTPVLSLHHDPNNWLNQKRIGFCAHGDFLLMKRKLHELINDPMQIEVMGNKAREFAEKEFSDPKIIDTYIRLFRGEN